MEGATGNADGSASVEGIESVRERGRGVQMILLAVFTIHCRAILQEAEQHLNHTAIQQVMTLKKRA